MAQAKKKATKKRVAKKKVAKKAKGLTLKQFGEKAAAARKKKATKKAAPKKKATKRKATKKAAPKKAAPKKTGPSIESTAFKALRANATNSEVLAAVKAAHPDAVTTMANVAWYRNKLRKTNSRVPSGHQVNARRKLVAARAAKAGK